MPLSTDARTRDVVSVPRLSECSTRDTDEFSDAVTRAYTPVRVEGHARRAFHGVIRSRTVGDVRLNEVAASQHEITLVGGHHTAQRSSDRFLKLCVVSSGHAASFRNHTHTEVGPNELIVQDNSQPYAMYAEDGTRLVFLLVPRRRIGLPDAVIDQFLGAPLHSDHALVTTVVPAVAWLSTHAGQLSESLATRVMGNTVGLLETLFLGIAGASGPDPHGGHDAVSSVAIRSFVGQHLGDPELNPRVIAAAHHVSVRYLHRIFEETGVTVSEYIRAERVERCRQDLENPYFDHLPVHAVAARWGLLNAAHFSHLFRARVGVSPSAYRDGYRVPGRCEEHAGADVAGERTVVPTP